MVRFYEYLSTNPTIIANGFRSAGIPQSIDAGKPILMNSDNGSGSDHESSSNSEYEDYQEDDETDGEDYETA